MSKFVKDQEVIVTNNGDTHDSADHWILKTTYYNNWQKGKLPNNGDVGTILGMVPKTKNFLFPVHFVRIHNTVFMINEKGLSEYREESKQTSLSFSGIREKYAELFSDEFFSIDLFGQYTEVNYGTECFQCPSEQDLFQILDALTVLSKFKVQR